jgi:hypothetical protein
MSRIALLSWLLFLPANGQSGNFNKEIDTYFESVLKGENYSLTSEAVKGADGKKILKLASRNINNANPQVRYKIIDLVKRKAVSEPDADLRKKFVLFLLGCIKDKDGGNSGVASKSLCWFAKTDFDKQAGDSLCNLLFIKPAHFDQLVKLAGYINNDKCREMLQNKLVSDSLLNLKDKWAIRLALARMGDAANAKYCFDKVKTQPVNDNVVTYLYPDLIYTRQPEAIHYMLGQILVDSKDCYSASPETEEKTICAFKIMEIAAPVIKNFPIQVDKYGDLDIDNYGDALITVRNWITTKPEIIISNETY